MAKNKPISFHRITGLHKESSERILTKAKQIVTENPDSDVRFMITDQAGDNINKTIKSSGYGYRINPASKYDAKDLTKGAKLRTEAEMKGGVKYHRLAEGGKTKSGYDKYWSDRLQELKKETKLVDESNDSEQILKIRKKNPTSTYDKKTGVRLGKATTEHYNPKNILLDEIGDETNSEKFQAGLDFVKNSYLNWEKKQSERPQIKKIDTSTGKKVEYLEPQTSTPWLNKQQLNKYNKLFGRAGYQDPHQSAGWSDPEGTHITKDFDSKEMTLSSNDNQNDYNESKQQGKLDFDPNAGPQTEDYDELPLHDQSLNTNDSTEYVDEHYAKTLELRESAGRNPDQLKIKTLSPEAYKKLKAGLTKRYKNAVAHGDKTARAFVKGGYKTGTSDIMEKGKSLGNWVRRDTRPANSDKNIVSVRKQETLSVKGITSKKIVNVPPQKSILTSTNVVKTKPRKGTVVKGQDSSLVKKKRYLPPVHKKINQRSKVRTKNPQEAKIKSQSKTKLVTTDVTPTIKKVTSTAKSTKKVAPRTPKQMSINYTLQDVFKSKKPTAPNVEYKHRSTAKAHGKIAGKGIKFTRGLGAFSIFSSILGTFRAKSEVEADFKRLGIKRDPTVLETMEQQFFPKGMIKRIKGFNDPA